MRPRIRFFLAILGRESRGVVASLFAFGLLAAALLACAAPAAAQNTVPDAELNVNAEPGDEKVSLHFKEPDDGGSPIIRYEYRVKVATGSYPATWTRVPEFTGNVGATLDLFVVVESLAGGTALANGTEYAFQVRAVNGVGAGMPDEDTATPQVNVPATYTLGPERGIIERRPFAPAPRVPADQRVSLRGVINDPDHQSAADERDDRFTYEWEWIRVRAGSDTVIAGAGSGARGGRTTEYVLTSADVGSQIKARVRYRDDRYNEEEFVTALFPASGTILPAAACAAPTYTGGAAEIWQDELKIQDIDHDDATPNRYGVVFGSRMFTAGSNTYEIDGIYRETVGAAADKLSFGLTADLTGTDKNQLILYICDEAYPLIDATLLPTRHNYLWPDTDDWSTYVTRTIRLARDAVAPTVTRARISGASLTIAFSEDLDGGSIPATTAFAVEVGGEPVELETGNTVVLGGDRVTLTLAEAPSSGSTITVDYAQPGTGNLRDPARNEVADFTATVTRPAPRPVIPRANPPGAPGSLIATPSDSQVFLSWKAPASSGGARVTRYEVRHADGTSVPAGTPWDSAGLNLEWTIAELTNGQQYAFEVRAVNSAGAGPAATATATPATPLGELLAPESLMAAWGDARVMLSWSEPADDGGAPVTGYEVRHVQGGSVPPDTLWQSAGLELEWTVADLTNGQQYAFEVRAVNVAGPGAVASTAARPIRLRVALFADEVAAEGEPLVLGVRRSGGLAYAAHAYVGVTDSAVPGVTAIDMGRGDGLGRHRLELAAGEAESTFTIAPEFDGVRAAERTLTVTLETAEVEIDGRRLTYEPEVPTLELAVMDGDAAVSVADARAEPGATTLRFRVSLDRTRDVPILVDYATADGTARAGQDYTAVSGALTLEPGQREAEVEVPVLVAPHLTGERTLRLTLSNPRSALIGAGEATGTIARVSDVPQAWLARFGRTASDQSAQAIRRRLEGGERQSHLTVAGLRFDTLVSGFMGGGGQRNDSSEVAVPALTAARAGAGRDHTFNGHSYGAGGPNGIASHAGFTGTTSGFRSGGHKERSGYAGPVDVTGSAGRRLPTLREALIGTSFFYTSAATQVDASSQRGDAKSASSTNGPGGFPPGWSVWGDVAATGFDGAQGGLTLDGNVVTGTVGFDFQGSGRWLGGLAVSHSNGAADYAESGTGGMLDSTLTSMHPYAQYAVSDRTQIWGVLGFGSGDFELTPAVGEALATDLDNRMVALGGRSVVRNRSAGAFELSLNTDLLWTSTEADAADWLAATTGEASRVRLMLEGRGGRTLDSGATLIPTLEAGLRYDGGDAETGAGLEFGAGLGYATGRVTVKFEVRGLLAHEDAEYKEWGLSGSLNYRPRDDGRGLSLTMASAWGVAESGVHSLWSRQDVAGLARNGAAMNASQRLETRIGYGMDGRKGRALWVPYVGADAAEDGQQVLRLGLKLTSGPNAEAGLEFGRRDRPQGGPQRAIELSGSVRF